MKTKLLFLNLAFAAAIPIGAASPTCVSPEVLVQFPIGAPVWELCLLPPSLSSGGDGSGIEIRNAYYNGHQVFKRAHNPILNVKYVSGAPCNCYRDWIDEENKFQVVTAASNPNPYNSSLTGNYAEAIMPPVTVCSNGGSHGDVPSSTGFKGVAVQRLTDRFILTTQLRAGWYRYFIEWTFYTDGKIEPRFGFAAVNATCVSNTHNHHAYWRFDFDIDGSNNDSIGAPPKGGVPRPQVATEQMRILPSTAKQPPLAVWDTVTERGYQVAEGPENLVDPVTQLPNDGGPFWNGNTYTFAVADAWLLNYDPNQINDGAGLSACPIQPGFLNFMNGEALNDNGDVVLWIRGGAVHPGGNLDTCTRVGPTLTAIGDWAP